MLLLLLQVRLRVCLLILLLTCLCDSWVGCLWCCSRMWSSQLLVEPVFYSGCIPRNCLPGGASLYRNSGMFKYGSNTFWIDLDLEQLGRACRIIHNGRKYWIHWTSNIGSIGRLILGPALRCGSVMACCGNLEWYICPSEWPNQMLVWPSQIGVWARVKCGYLEWQNRPNSFRSDRKWLSVVWAIEQKRAFFVRAWHRPGNLRYQVGWLTSYLVEWVGRKKGYVLVE